MEYLSQIESLTEECNNSKSQVSAEVELKMEELVESINEAEARIKALNEKCFDLKVDNTKMAEELKEKSEMADKYNLSLTVNNQLAKKVASLEAKINFFFKKSKAKDNK